MGIRIFQDGPIVNGYTVDAKTRKMVDDITRDYTPVQWANVAIYGAALSTEQVVEAEWNSPFLHRDALRDAIMRESGKHVTSYDAAQAILKGGK